MATPFSRTLRSLHADNFKGASWLAFLGLLALILWFGWFFLAQVDLYETSQSATIMPDNKITAVFPLSTTGHIQPGQPAQVQLEGMTSFIPARVTQASQTSQGLQVTLDLHPAPGSAIQPQPGMRGSVKIETEKASPAALVLRAIGPAGQIGLKL